MLAIASKSRFNQVPDVAPVADLIPGFDVLAWFGILAPAKTQMYRHQSIASRAKATRSVNYLFDTNVISALVHQRAGWQSLAARIDALKPEQRLISAIVLAELQTMVAKAANPESKRLKVWRVLLNFQLLDFGEMAALHTGRIRAHPEPRGIMNGHRNAVLFEGPLSQQRPQALPHCLDNQWLCFGGGVDVVGLKQVAALFYAIQYEWHHPGAVLFG